MQLVFTLFAIYLRRGAAKLFVCQTGVTALSPGGYLCKVKITMQQCSLVRSLTSPGRNGGSTYE
jgi:hypothetical protein